MITNVDNQPFVTVTSSITNKSSSSTTAKFVIDQDLRYQIDKNYESMDKKKTTDFIFS